MRKKVMSFVFAASLLTAVAVPMLGIGAASAAKPDCGGGNTPGQVVKTYATAGGVGDEVGGNGNSDGNPANGQAHSAAGRGGQNQAFLANCGVGSQAP